MSPGSLILKRANASRPSGQWQHEDYDVLADGKAVGRIYERASALGPPDMRWFWSVTAIVPAIPNKNQWPRAHSRRGENEVPRCLGEGQGWRLIRHGRKGAGSREESSMPRSPGSREQRRSLRLPGAPELRGAGVQYRQQ